MHILFVHQNFPAQFGHIARELIERHGYQCTFVTNRSTNDVAGIRVLQYAPRGGATRQTHYFTRTFENATAHAHGVFEACRAADGLRPDLVVGHSGFGSTLFLHELFDCPIINYFEYFYHPHNSDMDFRDDAAPEQNDILRAYCRNAMLMLDLENCQAGYSPTHWQRNRFPERYRDKIEVIFDGVDRTIWRRHENVSRQMGAFSVDENTRIVTYVSRGLESMRGFDIFMQVAQRIYQQMPNVLFVVVGEDRVAYGGDLRHLEGKTFRQHVLDQHDYDLSKFVFPGRMAPHQLAQLLSLSDLHIYLTVPFVLSWSLFDALSCGCTVVASDTAPVQELITHESNGLLADFHDVDRLAELSLRVLRDVPGHRHLGEAGASLIEQQYDLRLMLPRMLELYERVIKDHAG